VFLKDDFFHFGWRGEGRGVREGEQGGGSGGSGGGGVEGVEGAERIKEGRRGDLRWVIMPARQTVAPLESFVGIILGLPSPSSLNIR
jgi:hypothetical protein